MYVTIVLMNRRLTARNTILIVGRVVVVRRTILEICLVIVFIVIVWKVILWCVAIESSILIILHLSSLVHIDMTLSIWSLFAATVVVKLSDRRAILIGLVADWGVTYTFLGCGILELSLIRRYVFLGWFIFWNRGLMIIVMIGTCTCVIIIFKVIGSIVSIITCNWWLRL